MKTKKILLLAIIGLFIWILTGYQSAKYLTKTHQIQFDDITSFEGFSSCLFSYSVTNSHVTG